MEYQKTLTIFVILFISLISFVIGASIGIKITAWTITVSTDIEGMKNDLKIIALRTAITDKTFRSLGPQVKSLYENVVLEATNPEEYNRQIALQAKAKEDAAKNETKNETTTQNK